MPSFCSYCQSSRAKHQSCEPHSEVLSLILLSFCFTELDLLVKSRFSGFFRIANKDGSWVQVPTLCHGLTSSYLHLGSPLLWSPDFFKSTFHALSIQCLKVSIHLYEILRNRTATVSVILAMKYLAEPGQVLPNSIFIDHILRDI